MAKQQVLAIIWDRARQGGGGENSDLRRQVVKNTHLQVGWAMGIAGHGWCVAGWRRFTTPRPAHQ
jgi:hypothetical protein